MPKVKKNNEKSYCNHPCHWNQAGLNTRFTQTQFRELCHLHHRLPPLGGGVEIAQTSEPGLSTVGLGETTEFPKESWSKVIPGTPNDPFMVIFP